MTCAHPKTRAAYALLPAAESPTGKRTQEPIGRYCPACRKLVPA